MEKGILYGVGVGPGDPGLLTLKALRTISACPVVAAPRTPEGATLALDIARQAVDLDGKEILELPFAMLRDPQERRRRHRDAAGQILQRLGAGHSVALLNIGDVSLYATFGYIRELVLEQGFQAVAIPGVPSFCAVAAALGESLTAGMDTPLHIIPAGFDDLEQALDYPGAKVLLKAGKPLLRLRELLAKRGLAARAGAVQNCGLPGQRILRSLEEAEDPGPYLTTVVLKP